MYYRGILKQYATLFNVAQYIADWSAILLSSWLSYLLYLSETNLPEHYFLSVIVCIFLSIIIFQKFGLYQAWRGISLADEIKALVLAWSTIVVSLVVLSFITKTSTDYSRGWFVLWLFLGLIVLILFRACLRYFLRYMRKKGYNQKHIVLVGEVGHASAVADRLESYQWMGFSVCGYFSESQKEIENCSLTYLGKLDDISAYVTNHNIDQVWLTMSLRDEDKVQTVLHNLRHTTVDVRFIPDIFGLRLLNHSIMEIAGLPVLNLSVTPMTGINKLIKAIEDKCLALFILLLISPFLIIVSIAIKLSSPGPVFYRQERVGWNGKTFEILKFRSMPVDNEKHGVEWGSKNKSTTSLGNLLRKTSIDELPQFINVLKGDMSIVGPRPERTVFVDKLKDEIPGYMKKHLVKAGITGWAQVNGWRGDTDLTKRIEYDLFYIENWSLWLDIKIIIMTIFKGFINKNAY